MEEIDVQPELTAATLAPEEASMNIEKAKTIGVEPDAFIDNKDLNQNYESVKAQVSTTPAVAKKLSQSRTIASVMKDEVPIWTQIDNTMSSIGKSVSNAVPDWVVNHNDSRRVSQLYSKRLDGQLSKQELYELKYLENKTKRYQKANPGMSEGATAGEFTQGLAETVGGSLLDILFAVKDNPTLAATTIGVPGAIGTARGAVGGGPAGAVIGGIAATLAATLSPTGSPLIQAVYQYRIIRGDVHKELSQAKDSKGLPLNIPINIQRNYANGAALVGSLFEIVGFAKILGQTPVAQRLGKKVFIKIAASAAAEEAGKSIVASQAERSVGKVLKTIGASMAIEGGQEGFQQLSQQIFTSGGLTFNPIKKDTDLGLGVSNLWDQYKANAKTLLNEGKLQGPAREFALSILGGAVAGPVMTGTLTVATEAPLKVAKAVGARRKARAEALRTKTQQDLEARVLNRLAGMQMPQEGMPRTWKGAQGQQAQVIIDELVKKTSDTQLQQLQPAEANQLLADIAQQAGIPHAWLDPDDARAFSSDPQKAADMLKLMGEQGQSAASKDRQVKVATSQMLDFVRKYPETSGMFAFAPEALTANEALRRAEELKAKQQEVLSKVSKTAVTPKETVTGLATAEQADIKLQLEQVKLEQLRTSEATPEQIQTQEQIVRDIEARRDVLPSETEDQMAMDFAEQVTRKKALEAQDIVIAPDATQDQVTASFESREQAEAYWDRLDKEESRLKKIYHGTSGPEFEKLDPTRSGGMINFAEEKFVAEGYAHGAGGGRSRVTDNSELYIERVDSNEPGRLDWNPETKSYEGMWGNEQLSIPSQDAEDFIRESGDASVKRKTGRILESSYDPSKVLDITKSKENRTVLINILQSLASKGNKAAKKIAEESLYRGEPDLINGAWWGTTKLAKGTLYNPKMGEELQQISKTLKDAGYDGLRFNDDTGVTVALFEPSDRLQQVQDLKSKVETAYASLPSETDSIVQLQNDVATNEDTFGPQRYNEQAVIPPEIRNVVPGAARIESMAQEANKQYVEAVKDAAEREWTGVVNEQERIALTVEREIELENLANDPNIKIVENFINSSKLDANAREVLGGVKGKGPAFAIDINSLTPAERAQYENNPKLIERKVFAKKGGMNAADVAEMLGARDVAELMKALSESSTLNEAVDARLKARSEQIRNQIESSTPYNETAIAKSLDNKSNAVAQALEYYKNGDWTGFKKAIKAVVLPTPKVADIRAQAEKSARQTRISDLNTAQFTKGELRAKRKATDAVLKGDLNEAFQHKVNEIENIEAARATHKMTGEVNRRTNKVAKFFTPEVKAELEAAGPKYVDAIDNIMSMFNLSPYVTGTQKQGAYLALAQDMANKGQGDIALPEHVVADFDPRLAWDSLTAEQYIEIVDLMDNVHQLAKQKNRTIQSYNGRMDGAMVSLTESAVIANLADHPDRNENRAEQERPNSPKDVADNALGEMEALITNTNFAVQHLDRGKTDGFWHKLIIERIKGIGNFQGPWGTDAKQKMYLDVRKQWAAGIKKYGVTKFMNMGSERIKVKQFEGIPGLYNGDMTKLDLFVMSTYLGNQGNIDRVTNFNISEEVIWEVMNEHMTTDEMDMAQNLWDIYRAMEDRVVALEKMDGEDVELVQSKSFTFKGKEYRGGYAPIQFVTNNHEGLLGRVKQRLGDLFKKKEEGYSANYAARGMTARGYTEKRTGSDQRISLDVRTIALGLDEVITDLTMRVPVRDVAKLLQNPTISKEIISVIGKARYKAMIDGISSLTTSETARRLNGQIQGEAMLDSFFDAVESRVAITTLAANIGSLLMQPLSVGVAVENMGGIGATKHILNVVAKTAAPWNWNKVGKKYKLAKEINPSIENAANNIEAKNTAGIVDLLPTRRTWGGKPVNMIALARDHSINGLMSLFAAADVMIKVPVSLAAYEQYMKGEAPGQDGYKLWKMTDDEKHRAAISYAQKISESSLTHTDEFNKANIQKSSLGKRFTRYFNDLRNGLNTTIMSSRQLKWDFREAGKLAKEGDVEGSAKAYHSVADRALSMALISITMGVYEAAFRSFGSEDDEESLSPENIAYAAAKSRFLGAPFIRDLTFSAETGLAPSIPALRAGQDVVSAGSALKTVLNNYTGLLNDAEMDKELTDKQVKGLLSTTSYVLGGLPVNGPIKIVKALSDPEAQNVGPEKLGLSILGFFIDRAERFIEKFKDDPKMKPITDAVQKDVSAVKVVSGEPYEISEIDLAAFRKAENPSGKWDAQNPNSTAFGHYQITEGTWRDMMSRAPKSLMLTTDGLYQKDGAQAERAIKWLISDNARQLQEAGIEPTLDNIYGAHHFGAKGWIRVMNADDSDSVESAFADKAISSNEWLQNVNSVGEAKAWVRRYITKSKFAALKESRKTNVAKNP